MTLPAGSQTMFLPDGHLSERVWDAVITGLAWLWRPLRWFVALVVVVALFALMVVWLAHALELPLPDPHVVPPLRDALSHPRRIWAAAIAVLVLLPAAWWSHGARAQTRAADDPRPHYDLLRVRWLEPEDFIPRYIPRVYHWRLANANRPQPDLVAREALCAAARGRRNSPQGIWVVGRPLQGKSRLAWEAIQAVLPGWTLVRWAHTASRPFDMDAVRGQRVVLWLDDLDTYANPAEAPTLLDLPRLFRQARVRLVIVATCAQGGSAALARAQLGPLLDGLREVRLEDISAEEGDALVGALAKANIPARRAAFDGTPGSLVLDIPHMRAEVYPELPESARRALRALKLLRSAGIGTCSERRVRAIAEAAFGLPADPRAWPSARDALVAAGFIRLSHARVAHARAVEPVAAAYLDQAMPEYPAPGRSLVDDWPRLRAGLTLCRDAAGLFSLGNQYRARDMGDRMESLQHAEVCYWEAVRVSSARTAPLTWAGAQSNLGMTLAAEAQLVVGPERIQMLAVAIRGYRAALKIYRRLRIWENWARTQTNLGMALFEQADLVDDPQRSALLREAAGIFRGVARGRRREVTPTTPLRAQFGLNLIEREHAEAATEVGRLRQVQATIARLPALLPRGALPDTLPEHPAVPLPSPAMAHPRHPSAREPHMPDAEPGRPHDTHPLEEIFPARSDPHAPRDSLYQPFSGQHARGAVSRADADDGDTLRPHRVVISEEIHTHLEEHDGDEP